MFDKLGLAVSWVSKWNPKVTVVLAILAPFILTQLITSLRCFLALARKGDAKDPPIVPYATPYVGNLIAFAFDTRKFLGNLIKTFGTNVPVRIRVLNQKLYYISGSQSSLALFRASRDTTTTKASTLIVENAFGSPPSVRPALQRDNTGLSTQPLEGSNPIDPQDRIFYLNHKTVHTYLSGNGLIDLASRFMTSLEGELLNLDIGDEWIDVPDLYSIIQNSVFRASTTGFYGPHMLGLNPDLVADFWYFDTCLPGLFKNLPRWMIPKSFKIRDKLKNCFLKWQKHANQHYDWNNPEVAKLEWEEYFGAKIVREHQRNWGGVKGMTDEGMAASNLGFLWGANANVIPIIGWCIFDILLRPEILAQVHNEIGTTLDTSNKDHIAIDMPKILANPLLQSIYSEELRLRNGVTIHRVPIVSNFKIGPWKLPKDSMIILSAWYEQRDKSVWNQGSIDGQFHDVEDFWAERFIVYPNDPNSGPRKPSTTSNVKAKKEDVDAGSQPKFTTDPVTGSFIPYGGGQTICPGRFFAKQEALGAMAMFLTMFDMELKEKNKLPVPNMTFFPFGVIPPKGKFPARIRRRRH